MNGLRKPRGGSDDVYVTIAGACKKCFTHVVDETARPTYIQMRRDVVDVAAPDYIWKRARLKNHVLQKTLISYLIFLTIQEPSKRVHSYLIPWKPAQVIYGSA